MIWTAARFLFFTRAGHIALAVAAFAGLMAYVYTLGREAKQDDIDRENEEAAEAAEAGELGFSECVAAGRVWRFEAGECGGPLNGGGD